MSPTMAGQLGDLITTARLERGISLNQLAKETGIHRTSIARIESGEFASPRPAKLLTLAGALGLDATEVFEAIGYPAHELPTFGIYLRAKYGTHLSSKTIERIEKYVLRIVRQEHGIDLDNPPPETA